MIPLNKIIEAALDYGFMCEVACGTERPSTATLAKYVAEWPEIAEGHRLFLKVKAQRDAVQAEAESDSKTVNVPLATFSMSAPIEDVRNALPYTAGDGAYRAARPRAGFKRT